MGNDARIGDAKLVMAALVALATENLPGQLLALNHDVESFERTIGVRLTQSSSQQ